MPGIFYVSYGLLWVLVMIEGILLLLVYRHFGLIALGTAEGVQRDGLSVGEEALPISGITAQGEPVAWAAQPSRSYLLAFVSPECAPCARILPSINRFASTNNNVQVVLIVAGPRDGIIRLVNKFHPPTSVMCLADDGSGAHTRYRVRVTPFAFMIGSDSRIYAKGLCDAPTRLSNLLAAGGVEIPQGLLEAVEYSA